MDFSKQKYRLLKIKYPQRTPVVIINSDIALKKKKYLVENTMTGGQFIHFLRMRSTNEKKMKNIGLYLYINGVLINPSQEIKHYENNGFVYCILKKENVFG